ncbi:condensation domain-containing protein, partial [Paenibacillus polymyxa]|uniref:condensation domain-containing protein n=1 Tax=Paenibacillus polymyxa TaxID=1406 RepID=UPI002AB4CEC5
QMASAYWEEYLHGYEGQTVLPTSQRKSDTHKPRISEKLSYTLGAELSQLIRDFAKRHHVTVNTFFQTVWGILLQRYSNNDDVVFGGVVSGRPSHIHGIESMIGLFINLIPVRVNGNADSLFINLLAKNQKSSINSNNFSTFPLYEIQANTTQKQDLITHIMIFENYPLNQQMENEAGDINKALSLKNVSVTEQTNYDLNVIVVPEIDEEVTFYFEYNSNVYNHIILEKIWTNFVHVINQVTSNSNLLIQDIELLSEMEKQFIQSVSKGQSTDYPKDTPV